MKGKRYTEERITNSLRQVEGGTPYGDGVRLVNMWHVQWHLGDAVEAMPVFHLLRCFFRNGSAFCSAVSSA